jgi:ribosomal protein L35AE/L33A
MVEEDLFNEVNQSLQRYVDLKNTHSLEKLTEYLSEELVYMLNHEMEKLMGILYRIDVREPAVKAAFAQSNPKLIAPELARLIIERELEKAISRKNTRNT